MPSECAETDILCLQNQYVCFPTGSGGESIQKEQFKLVPY